VNVAKMQHRQPSGPHLSQRLSQLCTDPPGGIVRRLSVINTLTQTAHLQLYLIDIIA